MSNPLFVLRLTHLTEIGEKDPVIHEITGGEVCSPAKKRFMARALDVYANVYYATLSQFANGHGFVVVTDPQLQRTTGFPLVHLKKFIDAKILLTFHPPLCQQCWDDEKRTGALINVFRAKLSPETALPQVVDCAAAVSQELLDLFGSTDDRTVMQGLHPGVDPVKQMLSKSGGHN